MRIAYFVDTEYAIRNTEQVMPKVFYTEHDMDELKARGVMSIDLTENIAMTDLAIERAFKLGIKINRVGQGAPQASYSPSVNTYAAYPRETSEGDFLKVKAGVLARLNGQVDDAVLEATIRRVLKTRN